MGRSVLVGSGVVVLFAGALFVKHGVLYWIMFGAFLLVAGALMNEGKR